MIFGDHQKRVHSLTTFQMEAVVPMMIVRSKRSKRLANSLLCYDEVIEEEGDDEVDDDEMENVEA